MSNLAPVPTFVSLTPKEFPSEFEHIYRGRSHSSEHNYPEEKRLITGVDRRSRVLPYNDNRGGFAAIGLFRMMFNGDMYTGTASLIADGSFLLTCAHNLVDYDNITKKLIHVQSAWFEIRDNCHDKESGYLVRNRYNVIDYLVHPMYFTNPATESGFDIALCKIDIPHYDPVIPEIRSKYGLPSLNTVSCDVKQIGVVGFPAEYKGDKWGMVANVPDDKESDWYLYDQSEILVYDFIDTSEGQSGCPIMSGPDTVVGVHTGGKTSAKKNWGTNLTPAKIRWIKIATSLQ